MRLRWAGLALLIGCGSDPGNNEDCDPTAEPALEIGVGSDAYQTLDEAGGKATLVHGAQGGYHLELGLSADGLDVSELAAVTLTGSVDGDELATGSTWVQFRCNPDSGAAEAWKVRLVFEAEPAQLAGKTADVTAELTDGAGTAFAAQASLKIVDPTAR